METFEERVRRLTQEEIAIVAYDPSWPKQFVQEKAHLLSYLPPELVKRVEHFGSTSVPGLAAKPIIDILIEVTDLAAATLRIVPALESQGYESVSFPTPGGGRPAPYIWLIKRDPTTSH